jgi:hypothetical protein
MLFAFVDIFFRRRKWQYWWTCCTKKEPKGGGVKGGCKNMLKKCTLLPVTKNVEMLSNITKWTYK